MSLVMVNARSEYSRQRGFTFLELVIVIVLLGILAATAIPRFLNATDEAEVVALQGVAGGFTTATAMARAQWYAQGKPTNAVTGGSAVSAVDYGGKIIYLNEFGWPAATDTVGGVTANDQTVDECVQIWVGLMQSAPLITSNPNNRVKSRYFASLIDSNPDICRYELVVNTAANAKPTHYFDYELDDGNVTVIVPNPN